MEMTIGNLSLWVFKSTRKYSRYEESVNKRKNMYKEPSWGHCSFSNQDNKEVIQQDRGGVGENFSQGSSRILLQMQRILESNS